ncbi:MAG: BREX-3 system P-loop-containing protein BrxF, partial [Candidatus Aminicenantes bacterium]|nr:BREX-3 system P-loop-containing protein BrxF [Candidatus Aminicenantes bacterium]
QPYYRLVLLVGPVGSGKTPLLKALSRQHHTSTLNLNLALSQRLLDLTTRERPLRARRILEDLLAEHPGDTIALDNIELLFDPALQLNPLALLQQLSRQRTLVVAWGGTYDADHAVLTYAEPGHPEYRRYEHPEGMLITLL